MSSADCRSHTGSSAYKCVAWVLQSPVIPATIAAPTATATAAAAATASASASAVSILLHSTALARLYHNDTSFLLALAPRT